jgi:ATP-dependent helicase/nuclease subunit A
VSTSILRATATDLASRERALDPTRSFLVQAPAGAGKTELLIQRALRLLALAEVPESIVAITFTRKAAAEMRGRIVYALERAAAGDEPEAPHERVTHRLAQAALERDREKSWNLLQHPNRLRMRTIDSLCAALTRQMPWLSRLGAQPEVVEDAELLYTEAARRTLLDVERAGEHQAALERLLLHLDNNVPRVEKLLVEMLAVRDQWLELVVGESDAERRAELEQAMEYALVEGLGRADSLVPAGEWPLLVELARYAAFNLEDDHALSACRDLQAAPRAVAEDAPTWRGLAEMLLTREGGWRKHFNKNGGFPPAGKQHKQQCADLIGRLSAVAGLEDALCFLRVLPPARYTDEQWEVMRALFAVMKLAVAHLKLVFQGQGTADFCEIGEAARAALSNLEEPTELALGMEARIQHLLVDEFQDTSVAQFELLRRLTAGWQEGDGHTLFLVGDPMQSIYRFRQAEVGLFLQMTGGRIGDVAPEFLPLYVNHRSVAGLVGWGNNVFPHVFPERGDIGTGAVAFSPSASGQTAREEEAVSFDVFANGQDREEAERVVELIREARRKDANGSIAVLVRARTHLPAIVAALKRAGEKFRAVDIDSLAERTVVLDLLALTRAMLHLADRTAWLAILRAPWCGLTLNDLEALAGRDTTAVIWDLLARSLTALSEDGQVRAGRLRAALAAAFAERGRWPLRRWVERTWWALGGPACVSDDTGLLDAAGFLDLLEAHEHAGDLPDLGAFEHEVEKLFAQPDSAAPGSLQLLTIHKAKGLQFDTVILPGLGRKPRHDDPRLLLFAEQPREEGTTGRLLAPIRETGADLDPVYAYLRNLEKRKEANECVRLLYVATTRARSRLHLLGQADPAPGSLLAYLMPGLPPKWQRRLEEAGRVEAPVSAGINGVPLRRLPADWSAVALPAPVAVESRAPEISEIEEPSYVWVGDTLRHVGTVVHETLRRIGTQGLAHFDEAAIRARRPIFRAALANLGVAVDELADAVGRVETALLRTLASSRGRWILGDHAEARCECALAGVAGREIIQGTVDRTFVDEDGTRWIIDYKTSTHEGGGVETFLDEQQRRYRGQLERYARLLAPLGRPIRLGLYFPLLNQWREWAP